MSDSSQKSLDARLSKTGSVLLVLFELCVIIPVVGALIFLGVTHADSLSPILLLWAAAVAIAELLPVQSWRGMQLSTGFTLLMAGGAHWRP